MELSKFHTLAFAILLFCIRFANGWGIDGHLIICRLAQPRLTKAAANAVSELLPADAHSDLGSVCSWADRVRFRYHWSPPLHFIDTPDNLSRAVSINAGDCKDADGVQDRCVAGAINNYTTQLLDYGNSSASQYNLTEALLFLSHFMGDIHQPLHVGFTSDRGANTIDIHWYNRKSVLHHVWDSDIIETAERRFYESSVDELIDALQKNITSVWSEQATAWEATSADDYFLSRRAIVNLRLAQGGVRLAATLNRIFG